MNYFNRFLALALVSFMAPFSASAHSVSPQQVIKTVVGEVTDILLARSDTSSLTPAELSDIRKITADNIDYKYIASRILGRTGWKKLSTQQKKNYVAAYRTWLEGYITKKLTSYSNQAIKYGKANQGRRTATVPVFVSSEDSTGIIRLDFTLKNTKHGWKVVDFSSEGVSIPRAPQSDFRSMINGSSGYEKIMDRLAHLNS